MEALEEFISPLLTFRDLYGKYVHHYVSVVLDPQYKSNAAMKAILMPLHCGDIIGRRNMTQKYDENGLLPLVQNIYR